MESRYNAEPDSPPIYAEATATDLEIDLAAAASTLPKDFYVEGFAASAAERDIEFKINYTHDTLSVDDKAKAVVYRISSADDNNVIAALY